MNKAIRILAAVLMLSGLVFGLFSVAGAEAPQADADVIFLPRVDGNSLIHVQNVGTVEAQFEIVYEAGEVLAVDSGIVLPGSMWTFLPAADNAGSATVISLTENALFAVSVDRSGIGGTGNAAYTGVGTLQLPVAIANSYWLYAPVVFKDYNGWNSKVYVQNAFDAPVQVAVWFFDENGAQDFISNFQIGVGGSYELDPTAAPAGLADGTYSAWIRASGPIAAVVDEFKGGLAMTYRATAQFNAAEGKRVGAKFPAAYAPLVFKAYNNWNAGMRVQNTDNVNLAQVKVSFRDTAGTIVYTLEDQIMPRAFKDYFFADFSDLPQNFIGSATIESIPYSIPGISEAFATPIVAVAQQVKWTVPANDSVDVQQAMAYNTLNDFDLTVGGDYASRLAAPFMAKHVNGWSTGLEIMNITGAPVVVDIVTVFYDASGPVWTTDSHLGQWATNGRQLDLRYVDAIPGGFLGAAISQTGGDILGVVNEVAVAGISTDGGKSYEAYPAGRARK